MAEFAYNNAKNKSTDYMPFKLNCVYYSYVYFEEDTAPCTQSKIADELPIELQKLMTVCQQNFYHAQELQKQANNKDVKPRSYAPSDKVWLNSKYIKTKQNQKFEAKIFGPFQVSHPLDKQTYKCKQSKRLKIYDVFHMSVLK